MVAKFQIFISDTKLCSSHYRAFYKSRNIKSVNNPIEKLQWFKKLNEKTVLKYCLQPIDVNYNCRSYRKTSVSTFKTKGSSHRTTLSRVLNVCKTWFCYLLVHKTSATTTARFVFPTQPTHNNVSDLCVEMKHYRPVCNRKSLLISRWQYTL